MSKHKFNEPHAETPADHGVEPGSFLNNQRAASRHDLDTQLFQDDPRKTRKVWVLINREKGAEPFVSPSVNGITIKIPRGEKVMVPEAYVQALDLQIETTYAPAEDDPNTIISSDAPAVTKQVYGYAD